MKYEILYKIDVEKYYRTFNTKHFEIDIIGYNVYELLNKNKDIAGEGNK